MSRAHRPDVGARIGLGFMGLAIGLGCGTASTGPPAPKPSAVAALTAVAVAPEPEPTPEPAPEPEPPPVATASSPPEVIIDLKAHTTPLELAPGKTCEVAWHAARFEARDDGWWVISIGTIETIGGDLCTAATVYEDATEKKVICGNAPPGEACDFESGFTGGFIPAGGSTPDREFQGVLFADMNFDGYRDLCIQVMMGAYNYSQRCFLYRPQRRTFERYPALDPVIWATLDPAKKEIRHGMRVGGPTYMSAKYRWVGDALVMTQRVVTTLGERETEERRIGGKMRKVYAGPPRD